MVNIRGSLNFRWIFNNYFWYLFFLSCFIFFLRWSKGALFLDAYSLITRPFWPGTAQSEWLKSADLVEKDIRLKLLEDDNNRLRSILDLKINARSNRISAAVISRNTRGWWQQFEINKGSNSGIQNGYTVLGPGGLLGIVNSVTPLTSRVRLLTAPGSQVGVWVDRIKSHAILTGMGTNRVKVTFLDNNTKVKAGDVVTTSPASTLLPPNLVVGVIQSFNEKALPSPYGTVQLIASPEYIDWVEVVKH